MKVLVLGAGVAGVSSAWYLAEAGHEVTVIDRAEGVAMETSFANAGQLSYGYTTPWAAPGIPTKALKWLFKSHPPLLFRPDGSLYKLCQEKGVRFHFNQTISRIDHNGLRIKTVETETGQFEADAVVCALGCFSRTVLAQLDLNLPIYPVKGYSLTLPVTNSDGAPVSTVLDESYKVAITRFNNRIRVGGMAELSGYAIKLPEKRRETLALVVNDLFPEGGDLNQTLFWNGLRPMTPDSTPLIGRTRFDNLFLNTGHGTLGWTMSLGSAKLTADIVSGKDTEIRSDDLSLSRYQA